MVLILEFFDLSEKKVQQVFNTNNLSHCCNNFVVVKLEMWALTHSIEGLYLSGAEDEISKSQQAFIQS